MRSRPRRLAQILAVAGLAAAFTAAPLAAGSRAASAGQSDCSPGANWGTVRGDLADQVVALVNNHRSSLGLGPLAESRTLTASAVWKARHMAAYGYMSHSDPAPPVGRSTGERMAACGYTAGGWGENIAYGFRSAGSVMQGWLGSPGHKANIERSGFRAIGVGAAVASNGTVYWAQTFGSVADGRPSSTQATAVARTPSVGRTPARRTARPPARTRRALPTLEASELLQWGSRPRAGRLFTGRLTISKPGTRQRVEAGHASCRARAAGRQVWVGIHRFRNGFVVCRWRLPEGTKGTRITGTIRVRSGGKHTARWFSRLVR